MSNPNNNGNQKPAPVPGFSSEQQESLMKLLAKAMEDGMSAGMAKGLAMAEMSKQDALKRDRDAEEAIRARRQQGDCPKCGSTYMSCGGPELNAEGEMKAGEDKNHIMAVVQVEDEDEAPFFLGIHVNGRTFLSPNANTPIAIPRNSPIPYLLSEHVNSLKQNKRSRRGIREVGHITPTGNLVQAGSQPFTAWSNGTRR